MGRASFAMEYAVWCGGLCAEGHAVLILVVNATGEKTPLPPDLRRAIKPSRHSRLRQPALPLDHARTDAARRRLRRVKRGTL
jgi:hypothetical protein